MREKTIALVEGRDEFSTLQRIEEGYFPPNTPGSCWWLRWRGAPPCGLPSKSCLLSFVEASSSEDSPVVSSAGSKPEGAEISDVEVVEVLMDVVTVETAVDVTSVVEVAATVKVLENVSVVAANVVVTTVEVIALKVRVTGAAVTVLTGSEVSKIRTMSGRMVVVLVDVGTGALADEATK